MRQRLTITNQQRLATLAKCAPGLSGLAFARKETNPDGRLPLGIPATGRIALAGPTLDPIKSRPAHRDCPKTQPFAGQFLPGETAAADKATIHTIDKFRPIVVIVPAPFAKWRWRFPDDLIVRLLTRPGTAG